MTMIPSRLWLGPAYRVRESFRPFELLQGPSNSQIGIRIARTSTAHKSWSTRHQAQENATPFALWALMGESVTTLRLRPVIPISGVMILQSAAQKLVIAGKRIRIVMSLDRPSPRAQTFRRIG